MHEVGIANSILDAVRLEAARHPETGPRKVGVRIGELAAIDPEALQFSFEVLTRGTALEGMGLEILNCPRRHRCLACATEFVVKEYDFECPQCGEGHTQCVSGAELELAYLEMEEREPSTA